jgi:polar amino acid transport system substrate-binding protein
MRYPRFTVVAALLAALGAATAASAATPSSIKPPPAIAQAGKVVFCSDISFPPFESYTSANKAIGADVELGTTLAKLMGVSATWRNTSFDGIIPALQAKQCDAIMSGLYDKASRRKVVDFVDYALIGNSIVVPKGNSHHVKSLAGLSGLRVAVQSGTTLRLQLEAANKKLGAAGKKQMTIQSFPKDSDAFQQLIAGNVDAYYTVTSTAAYYGKKTGNKTEIAGPQISALPFGIATLKSNSALHKAFAQGLAQLRKSGQYLTILKRWGVANGALKG